MTNLPEELLNPPERYLRDLQVGDQCYVTQA
jgi:hypothetical protein